MEFKHRDFDNKLLVNTEWNYLCSGNYLTYKNTGLGIIQFFDRSYKPKYNIPKLREKYKNKRNCIKVNNNCAEKLIAICSLGKKYKTEELSNLECQIVKKLKIEHLVISNKYGSGYKCAICGSIVSKLASHLLVHKNITSKEYYDKYLRKGNEGKCAICGKPCKFLDIKRGYLKCCSSECAHKLTGINCKHTFLERYNVINISQLNDIKEKKKATNLKKLGVEAPLQNKDILRKFEDTCKKNLGVKNPMQNAEVLKKVERTNLEKRNVKCVFESEDVKEQIRETNRKNCGCDYWHQLPEFQEVVKKSNLKKYGVDYPNQTEFNRARVSELIKESFPNRRKRNGGYLSKEEREFSKLLKKHKIKFEYEYRVNNHTFDFAVFVNGKLDCLVDIDGEFWHGILTDLNGAYDYTRYLKVPKHVKYVVADSLKLKLGVKEVLRVIRMTYSKWKLDLLSHIPKEIEYPKYSEKHLIKSWNLLCKEQKYKAVFVRSNVGKSLVIHFCPKYSFRNLDYSKVKNNLFYCSCYSKQYLDGYENLANIPLLRKKYSTNDGKEIVVKKHSTEKMLAICSLGKVYCSKTAIDNESKELAKFLKLKIKRI